MQPIFEERRKTDRARVIYGGTVAFNQKQTVLDCIVQNYSDDGAKLALDDPGLMPDHIDLLINRKGRAYAADVVWRNGHEAGVSFRPLQNDKAPVSIDWARKLRDCETEKRALKAQLDRLLSKP